VLGFIFGGARARPSSPPPSSFPNTSISGIFFLALALSKLEALKISGGGAGEGREYLAGDARADGAGRAAARGRAKRGEDPEET